MTRRTSAVGRADLLRALDLADADVQRQLRLAKALHFFEQPPEPDQDQDQLALLAAAAALRNGNTASTTAAPDAPALTRQQPSKRTPLQAPLFGITHVHAIAQAQADTRPALAPLAAHDYAPSAGVGARLHPQALLPMPALARRAQAALPTHEAGRVLDSARAVHLLARVQTPTRWPMRVWPQAPAHVSVIVDRSLHLRPYWDDQNQIVAALGQWLGVGNLSTRTVQGDPWQASAAWSHGQTIAVPPLAPQPADHIVLLLTDMDSLRWGGAAPAALARWVQAIRLWGRAGAKVLTCPPCSAQLLPQDWPAPVAWLPLGQTSGQTNRQTIRQIRGQGRTQQTGKIVTQTADQTTAPPSAALERLLTLLACARRIEPELVRAVRRLDPLLAAEPGLEAQLWSYRPALDAGYDVAIWKAAAALDYRIKFAALNNPPLQQAVLRAVLAIHAVRGRAIEVQDYLVWASYVDAATAAPYRQQIADAAIWLQSVPLGHNAKGGAAPGLIAFAQQTQAAQGGDARLLERFPDAFGPLWGIAHQAAERQGHLPPDPGALPPEKLALWRESLQADAAPVTYQLQQHGQQLVLSSVLASHAASTPPMPTQPTQPIAWPMGMPFSVTSLLVEANHSSSTPHPSRQRSFGYPQQAVLLGAALPGAGWRVQTHALALDVGNIALPPETVDSGHDQYGVFADVAINANQAQNGSAKPIIVRFRYIAAGQFMMGSPANEAERESDEGPQHRVTISQGFWLADTACTQALWQAVMGNNPSNFQGKQGGPDHPVENVSWLMIQPFLKKLTDLLPGCQVTLPTEAEWEYACRAGSSTPFSFGETISTVQVNYDGNFPYGKGEKGGFRRSTVVVKKLPCNYFGLYQMHGNVWEWCADAHRTYTAEAIKDPNLGAALHGVRGGKDTLKVLRGGGWAFGARFTRSAYRPYFRPDWRDNFAGFRLALRF